MSTSAHSPGRCNGERSALNSTLFSGGAQRRYRRGEALFSEGDISDRVLLIERGWVKITHASAQGHQSVLGLRGPGDIVGELSTLDGSPRSASAVAADDVHALTISGSEFLRLLKDDAQATHALLLILAGRLRDADRKRIELTTLNTLGRVACRLLELAEGFGVPTCDAVRVDLPLSQEELAGWCGSSREATVKALRQLRELGCVATGRGTVTILDSAALNRHARPPTGAQQ